jgi:hypothetical protein
MRTISRPSQIGAVVTIATLASIAIAGAPAAAGPSNTPEVSGVVVQAPVANHPQQPHVLADEVGDLVVRMAGEVCSGTPIRGTVYVVTAAHCVLTDSGEVTQRTVVRDHVRYPAVDVLVDTRYHDHPSEEFDAAVLVMARPIPGPSVRVGVALPDSGSVTLAGFQPLDSDGSLLRSRKGVDAETALPYAAAGCVDQIDALNVSADRVIVPCGLVPGGSGGGLYAEQHGELVLVGILSTVTADQQANGVVPLASLQELLAHPERYAHGFHAEAGRSADRAGESWNGPAPSAGGGPATGESDDSYFARTGQHLPNG